jgi:hypothetical protein
MRTEAAMKRAVAMGGLLTILGVGLALAAPPPAPEAQAASATAAGPPAAFVVEYYYRFRWGFEEEFMDLFRRNHLPFLRRMLEKGILLEVRLDKPREHMTESERWDFRTTLVYRDAATAYAPDNIDEADFVAIVPDAAAEEFKRQEQRRFELLLAHWDVNVGPIESFTPSSLPEQTKALGK